VEMMVFGAYDVAERPLCFQLVVLAAALAIPAAVLRPGCLSAVYVADSATIADWMHFDRPTDRKGRSQAGPCRV